MRVPEPRLHVAMLMETHEETRKGRKVLTPKGILTSLLLNRRSNTARTLLWCTVDPTFKGSRPHDPQKNRAKSIDFAYLTTSVRPD